MTESSPSANYSVLEKALQVALSDNGTPDQTLSMVIFEPSSPAKGIQVLLPGSTYDHRYYDLQTRTKQISQARKAASDGWLTVAVDRLGTGKSSRPAAASLDASSHASTIHQLVTDLKSKYPKLPIVLVGHSFGSVVALKEAAVYKDVDALVITGLLHNAASAQGLFATIMHPAAEDNAFKNNPAPADYVTSRDGLRHLFYWPFNAEVETVGADNDCKQTTTPNETRDFSAEQTEGGCISRNVTVPVFSLIGQHDTFYFEPDQIHQIINKEKTFYTQSPLFEVKVIPGVGHDLALHKNADDTTQTINEWLDSNIIKSATANK